jgi:hypothetical protein
VGILTELVEMVKDRMSFRLYIEGRPPLRKIFERAHEVVSRSTRGVRPPDLVPNGAAHQLVGACSVCGGFHSPLVEVAA